jgi:malate dehydrogenase
MRAKKSMTIYQYKKPKIALIGAGNIGGTLAHLILLKQLGDVVLFDVKEDMPQGKQLDLMHAAAIDRLDTHIKGTNDYQDIKDADFVIVTAGSPRKPGMSRDDLLLINAEVIKSVGQAIKDYCPNAFIICITNPLDAMVYLLHKYSGVPSHKIIGMAGVLDTARFKYFLADHFKASLKNIDAFVLGGHGDTMVPLTGLSYVNGLSLDAHVKIGNISQEALDSIVHRTRFAGGEIVNLLKVGSAFYAPAASAVEMMEAVLFDKKQVVSAAAYIQDGYGVTKPMFLGLPIVLGHHGVEKILQLPLNEKEKDNMNISVKAVLDVLADLERLGFI